MKTNEGLQNKKVKRRYRKYFCFCKCLKGEEEKEQVGVILSDNSVQCASWDGRHGESRKLCL